MREEYAGRPGWACVALVDREGRLLLERSAGARWRLPGGAVGEGERPREAALEAFAAATGVRLGRMRLYDSCEDEGGAGVVRLYFADDEVEPARTAREERELRFVAPREALAGQWEGPGRELLERFVASDFYRGTVGMRAAFTRGVGIIEIDRWGRLLLQLRDADLPPERFPDAWCIPGGLIEAGEPADAAALREFEEETGQLLEDLRLFRVYRKASDLPGSLTDVYHVYYVDADIAEEWIEVHEGQAFRYFGPNELAGLRIPPHARTVLGQFLQSTAYRAMFH